MAFRREKLVEKADMMLKRKNFLLNVAGHLLKSLLHRASNFLRCQEKSKNL